MVDEARSIVSEIDHKFVGNETLRNMHDDVLFHLNFNRKDHDLQAMFGDVKFVCIGGTVRRMKEFAHLVAKEFDIDSDKELEDLAAGGHRYSMFKVGPVLCANHGMGYASMAILLVEVIKLLNYAGVGNPIILRIGTCGGLNVPCGTVVISNEVVNDFFEPYARIAIFGKITTRPAVVSDEFAETLKSIAENTSTIDFPVITGKTMSHEHLYETTAMKNNVIMEAEDQDREEFFEKMKENKIVNLDMESLMLFSLAHALHIRAGAITVVVNDILTDVMEAPKPEQLLEWESRPQKVALEFIKYKLEVEILMGGV